MTAYQLGYAAGEQALGSTNPYSFKDEFNLAVEWEEGYIDAMSDNVDWFKD